LILLLIFGNIEAIEQKNNVESARTERPQAKRENRRKVADDTSAAIRIFEQYVTEKHTDSKTGRDIGQLFALLPTHNSTPERLKDFAEELVRLYDKELKRAYYGKGLKKGTKKKCTLYRKINEFFDNSGILSRISPAYAGLYTLCRLRYEIDDKRGSREEHRAIECLIENLLNQEQTALKDLNITGEALFKIIYTAWKIVVESRQGKTTTNYHIDVLFGQVFDTFTPDLTAREIPGFRLRNQGNPARVGKMRLVNGQLYYHAHLESSKGGEYDDHISSIKVPLSSKHPSKKLFYLSTKIMVPSLTFRLTIMVNFLSLQSKVLYT